MKGPHQLRVGFDYRRTTPISNTNPPYQLITTFSTEQQVIAGVAPSRTVTAYVPQYPIFLNFSAFADDTWKVSRNLTITLGLRWDVNPPPTEKTGKNELAVNEITKNLALSDYDSLQAQFQRRLSRGLQALISYTWSHALDNDSASGTLRLAQRGNALFDIRHVFGAAVTYDVPQVGNSWMGRALLSAWPLDSSVHAQTALPVDLVASTLVNPLDGSLVNVRPNLVPGVPLYLSDPHVPGGEKINGAAFSLPPAGQSGNLGRNQLRGLGAWQADSALRRQFSLTERWKLQFRFEAFNLFNHPNFGTTQTTLTAANFGQATAMLGAQFSGVNPLYQIGGPRSIQLALKLSF